MPDNERSFNPADADSPLVSRLLYQMIDEKYRTLLDESSDLMCITDREGKFIYVNRKLADSLGYTKKDLMGMHFNDIIAEESRPAFAEKAKEFLKGGKIRFGNFVLKTKFKGRIIGEMSSMAFYDNAGKYCGAKAVFKDHTRFLEIETLEKKYESMLEDGIGSLDYIVMILDKGLKVKWATSSVRKYFCLDKALVVGEDMRSLLKEKVCAAIRENEPFLERILSAYEANVHVAGLESEVVGAGGATYVLEYWSYPITHGELTGGRIEIWRDITQRKKSEEQLEYYYKKIHAIMEHAVEGIVELRTDNSIEFVNQSFLGMIGYTDMEMLDRPLSDFITVDERTRLVSVKLIRKTREITFIRKNGLPLYTLMSSIPLVFGTQPPHALCFISDITETKAAALKLRDANLQLRALNDSLLDLSLRDVRTGVYNYRYLTERLTEEVKRARRYFRPFSLIMIDIDFFKAVNDAYGHSFGDVVLKEFAALLKNSVRETDILVRSGGEEFVVFLADTDSSGALTVAHKIVKAVEATALGDDRRKISITISLGVASYPEAGTQEPAALLEAADSAMYRSKDKGRNQVTVYSSVVFEKKDQKEVTSQEAFFERLKERLKSINQRNEESIMESIMPMVREVEKRLGYSHGYVEAVVKHVEQLAESFGLSQSECRRARRAALLCNLGLLTIPEKMLQKQGPLTPEERKLVNEHPVRGLEVVRDFSFLNPCGRDILYHQEHFDGTGYPEGLKAEKIPPVSRMIAVAEAYEALTHARPYRARVFSKDEALQLISQESGRQFDPAVVDHFLKIVR